MTTMTVAQALMTFLTRQYTVDGDTRVRTIAGTFGIFGHGNVAGIGQARVSSTMTSPGRCLTTRRGTNRRWSTSPSATPG